MAIFLSGMRAAFASVALCSTSLTCVAQTPQSRFISQQNAAETNVTDWIGAAVVNGASDVIGNINYLLVDQTGQIKTVAVGVGGFLGMGEKNVALPFEVFTLVDETPIMFRVAATRAELEAAPKFEWKRPPIGVRIEDQVKAAAEKVTETAKTLSKRASDAMKSQ